MAFYRTYIKLQLSCVLYVLSRKILLCTCSKIMSAIVIMICVCSIQATSHDSVYVRQLPELGRLSCILALSYETPTVAK